MLKKDSQLIKVLEKFPDQNPNPVLRFSDKGVLLYYNNPSDPIINAWKIKINDKHIEVIVRQMMQKVVIIDPGDTTLLQDEKIDKNHFRKVNDAIFEQKIITDIGDSKKRIKEDFLRILRYFRFYAYYGKNNIEKNQINTFKNLSSNLKKLSSERLYYEFEKILLSNNAYKVIKLMQNSGVLKYIIFNKNYIERIKSLNKFNKIISYYKESGVKNSIKSIILVKIEKVSEVLSPLYDLGYTEEELKTKWKKHYKF